jgi:outer membrane protein
VNPAAARRLRASACVLWTCVLGWPSVEPAFGQAVGENAPPQSVAVTGDQLLDLAQEAADAGNPQAAEAAYRALFSDPSVEVRSEARFRLAMLFVQLRRLAPAAVLLREVLDEQPHAHRVRLELARVLELLGDEAGARRALREAQAGGLPPEVARFVDRYSAALRARKPYGASLDVALAPDTNINRATRSSTLGTVLGDFTLDQDARQKSGVGVALRGQIYGRHRFHPDINLLARVAASADVYGQGSFNDLAIGVSLGPEISLGSDRLAAEVGGQLRWYGGQAYSRTASVTLNYLHPLDRRSQLRGVASIALIENQLNALQGGTQYGASVSYERALSERAGIGATVGFERQALRDPGYATLGKQLTLFAYREFGSITAVASFSHARLAADERLPLYPVRRSDRFYRASIGATMRSLEVRGFAPFVRLTLERNASTVELHDYRRRRTEFGLTRAF